MDHECPRPPCGKKKRKAQHEGRCRPGTLAGDSTGSSKRTDAEVDPGLARGGGHAAAISASSRCMCVGFGSSKPKPPKCLHQLGANRPRKPTLGWKTTGPLPTRVQYREILSRTCDPERDAPVRLSTTPEFKEEDLL